MASKRKRETGREKRKVTVKTAVSRTAQTANGFLVRFQLLRLALQRVFRQNSWDEWV